MHSSQWAVKRYQSKVTPMIADNARRNRGLEASNRERVGVDCA